MEYHDEWKKANVVPIHKKNSKNDVLTYRPISLLSNISKRDRERSVYKIIHILDDQQPTNMEEL